MTDVARYISYDNFTFFSRDCLKGKKVKSHRNHCCLASPALYPVYQQKGKKCREIICNVIMWAVSSPAVGGLAHQMSSSALPDTFNERDEQENEESEL